MATFTIYRDTKREYRWRLRANNGEIIADSAEGYTTKSACESGLALVKREAPTANTVDQS